MARRMFDPFPKDAEKFGLSLFSLGVICAFFSVTIAIIVVGVIITGIITILVSNKESIEDNYGDKSFIELSDHIFKDVLSNAANTKSKNERLNRKLIRLQKNNLDDFKGSVRFRNKEKIIKEIEETKLSVKPEIIIKNDLHDDLTKTIPFPNPNDCLVFLLDDMNGGNKEIMNDGIGKLPYTIDCNPVISFFSKQLQVCFFSKGLLLYSDKKIAVIKYENVKFSYNKITKVEHWFENYSKKKFHIIRDYWDHSRFDGGPDLRYKVVFHPVCLGWFFDELYSRAKIVFFRFIRQLAAASCRMAVFQRGKAC
ncbi:MAG: hypothetical protein II945_00640, partial [Bacteroidales bacterium]|nr:hypothetical protein [Bacteroidales bacterium]